MLCSTLYVKYFFVPFFVVVAGNIDTAQFTEKIQNISGNRIGVHHPSFHLDLPLFCDWNDEVSLLVSESVFYNFQVMVA